MSKASVQVVGSVMVMLTTPSLGFCGRLTWTHLATGRQYRLSFAFAYILASSHGMLTEKLLLPCASFGDGLCVARNEPFSRMGACLTRGAAATAGAGAATGGGAATITTASTTAAAGAAVGAGVADSASPVATGRIAAAPISMGAPASSAPIAVGASVASGGATALPLASATTATAGSAAAAAAGAADCDGSLAPLVIFRSVRGKDVAVRVDARPSFSRNEFSDGTENSRRVPRTAAWAEMMQPAYISSRHSMGAVKKTLPVGAASSERVQVISPASATGGGGAADAPLAPAAPELNLLATSSHLQERANRQGESPNASAEARARSYHSNAARDMRSCVSLS